MGRFESIFYSVAAGARLSPADIPRTSGYSATGDVVLTDCARRAIRQAPSCSGFKSQRQIEVFRSLHDAMALWP
jgi:hypothetical protein